MSHNDWHLTTEQLSASLDGQLSPDEQARLQTHLHACQQCQLRLADLRQTVTLLHALPRLNPPRSFTLPVGDAVVTPISAHSNSTGSSRATATRIRRPTWPGYIRATMRTLSAIAAVLGMVFLLSTALPLVQGRSVQFSASSAQPARSTAGGSSGQLQATQGGQQDSNKTTPQTALTPRVATPHATVTPGATATSGTAVQAPQPTTPVHAPLIDLNNVGERALLGLVLFVLGLSGFFLLSRWRVSKR